MKASKSIFENGRCHDPCSGDFFPGYCGDFIPDMHYGIMRRYMPPWMTYRLNCAKAETRYCGRWGCFF